MENLWRCLTCILHGLWDCFSGIWGLYRVLHQQKPGSNREDVRTLSSTRHTNSGTVKEKFLQCFTFGICFYISSEIYYRYFLGYLFILLVDLCGEDLNSSGISFIHATLIMTFEILWICPLFVLSKVLNFFWYQDIADLIFIEKGIRKNKDMKISECFADQTKSLILQMIFCLQGYAVYFVPLHEYAQHVWYILHLALLSSLYAFEYKWVHMGWPVHRRLLNINKKWPYYLGFGLPLAVITTCIPSFIMSVIVFTTLFPLYVVISAMKRDTESPIFSHPFNFFKISDFVSELIFSSFWWILAFFGLSPHRR